MTPSLLPECKEIGGRIGKKGREALAADAGQAESFSVPSKLTLRASFKEKHEFESGLTLCCTLRNSSDSRRRFDLVFR